MTNYRDAVLSAIESKFPGKGRGMSAGSSSEVRSVIPSGIEAVDYYVLGCGGLPTGRIVELFGEEGSGKSSLAFCFMAGAQKAGGLAILCETENALQVKRAAVFGVDTEKAILLEPTTMEEALNQMKVALETIPNGVGPNILAWDSLAATSLSAQVDSAFGEAKIMGKRGKLTSEALPLLGRLAREKSTTLLIVNQLRDKIGVMFGDTTTTPGGNAPKFQASVRLRLWRGSAVK